MPTDSPNPLVVGLSSGVLECPSGGGRPDGGIRPDGIGTYTRELGRHLAQLGVDVRHVGSPRRSGWRLLRPTPATSSFPLPVTWLGAASSALRIPTPGGRRVAAGIDIYHATDLVVPRLLRTPVVATVYDAIPIANPQWTSPRLRRAKNWLLRDWVGRADLVIAISHAAVADLVTHFDLPRERIRVVPLGVDDAWFDQPDAGEIVSVLRQHSLAPGYFLHVGTLQPRKNLDHLVSAYERLSAGIRRRRQLVLVGKYGWAAEDLRGRLAALRKESRVLWLDYLPQREVRALYAAAGVLVFPSLAEGFGLPVLEAMAAGVRVIASDLAALREVAAGHATFIDAGSIDALAAAMTGADAADDAPAARMERRRHARRFDWRQTAAQTIEVYRELVPG
jgi:alpha-1,3-rhamnosyl/mannosyltransferase